MRRTFPLIATIAAEVAAVFGGAPPAVADTTAPEPVAVAQPEAARAEPPAESTPDTSSDPAPDAPIDPVEPDPGEPVASTPPVQFKESTFAVRTGRVGDPAAIASSLAEGSGEAVESTTDTTTRRGVDSGTTATSTVPQRENSVRADHSASSNALPPAATPTPTTTSSTTSTPATVSPTAPTAVSMTSASSHLVVEGDDLWHIAASHLASVTGREVAALSTAEIVRYWVRVCEDNRTHLQSGDLSLIYAGEVVELPAR
jgi:hypothetical protein